MAIIISHRANLTGPKSAHWGENHPSSVRAALINGFDVEIDVWLIDNKLILGHDNADYQVPKEFFYNDRLWVHCKNIEAAHYFYGHPTVHSFYHQNDDITLTSSQLLWSYPRQSVLLTDKSIAVIPELVKDWANLEKCYGICTDFPIELRKNIQYKL